MPNICVDVKEKKDILYLRQAPWSVKKVLKMTQLKNCPPPPPQRVRRAIFNLHVTLSKQFYIFHLSLSVIRYMMDGRYFFSKKIQMSYHRDWNIAAKLWQYNASFTRSILVIYGPMIRPRM
jgi:hypothetical protein